MILLELSGFGVSTFFGVACKPRFSRRSVCVSFGFVVASRVQPFWLFSVVEVALVFK